MQHRYLFIIACICAINSAQSAFAQPEGATWQRNFALVGAIPINGATGVKEWTGNKTALLPLAYTVSFS